MARAETSIPVADALGVIRKRQRVRGMQSHVILDLYLKERVLSSTLCARCEHFDPQIRHVPRGKPVITLLCRAEENPIALFEAVPPWQEPTCSKFEPKN